MTLTHNVLRALKASNAERKRMSDDPEAQRRPAPDPILARARTIGEDGRVLVALDAGEMNALRAYWDNQAEVAARATRMFGRRH